jgi:hypothetical protein
MRHSLEPRKWRKHRAGGMVDEPDGMKVKRATGDCYVLLSIENVDFEGSLG